MTISFLNYENEQKQKSNTINIFSSSEEIGESKNACSVTVSIFYCIVLQYKSYQSLLVNGNNPSDYVTLCDNIS